MNILEAMRDPELFGPMFRPSWLGRDSWASWRACLATLFSLPLTDEQKVLALKHTGRGTLPTQPVNEAYLGIGRRGGKSRVASLIAVFLAAFYNYESLLAAGETGVVMLVAPDREQAKVLFDYARGFLRAVPMLERMIVRETAESIELSNRISIEVRTASYRTIRGFTVVAAIVDECAFLPTDFSAEPDSELLTALRPSMATIPTSMLLCLSTPYARKGELYRACQEHFGKDSPVIFWNASSLVMNPSLAHRVVDTAFRADPIAAAAEYGRDDFVQFRSDVEGFVPLEVIESRIARGRFELPPVPDTTYVAFVDPSGGQQDAMTLGVAHFEKGTAVLDCLRERVAPFSPEEAVAEFSETLKTYRVSTVVGDRYGGAWPAEAFQRRGVAYRPCERTRSELYLELLPALMSGQVELLDNKRLVAQLVGLERRTARAGKDSVNHALGSHDDIANATAGALIAALGGAGGAYGWLDWIKGVAAGTIPDPTRPPTVLERVRTGQEKVSEDATTCPSCGSALLRKLSSGTEKRCQQCGKQFGLPLKSAAPMTRGEWLRPPGRG